MTGDEDMPENIRTDEWKDINLDYTGENNFASFFSSDGNIHTYPAKAVPEMVNSLLVKLKELYNIENVLDPFVGSGTIALEAKHLGLDFYGSDLNPLAILLSNTKMMTIQRTPYIKRRVLDFANDSIELYAEEKIIPLENFDNIDYWFKENNIKELSFLKRRMDMFLKNSRCYRKEFALILLTAFSSTVRASSLSRNGEFKLYRMSPNDISNFNIDTIVKFKKNIEDILDMLVSVNINKSETESEIYLENAKNLSYMKERKVDLIMTSPPYGDSQSTVAYGQFSRLSLQWMGDLMRKYLNINFETENCDNELLGGKKSQIGIINTDDFYNSSTIKNLIVEIDCLIISELEKSKQNKKDLVEIIDNLKKGYTLNKIDLESNITLFELIKERVRLDIFRLINYKKTKFTKKEIKDLSRKYRDIFFAELFSNDRKKQKKRLVQLKRKLPFVLQTIERKIKSQPKRKEEVICFFKDLYHVVLETDRVLSDGGVQTWIVGHRTILGEIVINMEGILKDWFKNMGYTLITSLERKYSFKRMPHHINSTISRNNQVQTMMNEYILIVKKADK